MTGMKASTIKAVLRNKVESIAKSFTLDPNATEYHYDKETQKETSTPNYTREQLVQNEKFVQMFKDNVIISGGAIASMLQGEAPNDYDIYLKTKSAVLNIANYYVETFNKNRKKPTGGVAVTPFVKEEKFVNIKGEEEDRVCIYVKSAGVIGDESREYHYFESTSERSADEFLESSGVNPIDIGEDLIDYTKWERTQNGRCDYRPVFLSDNAITLNNKVQIIIRFYGDAEQIHKNFDFAHAMCWFDYKEDRLELPQESLEALLSKNLVYKGSLYPIASLFRIRKFLERGFRITAGQMLKMIWQVNELNLKDGRILRDQLLGVDVAYMRELIRAIESEERLGKKIDAIYLAKLVDKVFE